jgi:transposase
VYSDSPTGDRQYKATLTITGKTFRYFRSIGIKLNNILAEGYGSTKKVAEAEVYNKALKYVFKQGLKQKIISEIVEKHRMAYLELYPDVKEKSVKQGFVYIEFKKSENYMQTLLQLLGSTEEKQQEILATFTESSANFNQEVAKQALFEKYMATPY